MIILGIDPGSRITGYGIVQKKGNRTVHLDNGAIHCADAPDFASRLAIIFTRVQELIKTFSAEALAVESIFYGKNAMSTIKLGHARGTALAAASLLGLPVAEYAPTEVKKAVVGYGVATKDQVQKMVKALLNLPQVPEENASDALAVALCHAHSIVMRRLE
jgi:crossover junction endodeoxyribonuclease RuvC